MARDSLRTVEPAKLSACQSAEKVCTRLNASSVMSFMFLADIGIRNLMAVLRITENAR